MAKRSYYAVLWPRGVASLQCNDGTTVLYRDVVVFDSLARRNEWVSDGRAYRQEPGYREAVNRADLTARELRNARELPDTRTDPDGTQCDVCGSAPYTSYRCPQCGLWCCEVDYEWHGNQNNDGDCHNTGVFQCP